MLSAIVRHTYVLNGPSRADWGRLECLGRGGAGQCLDAKAILCSQSGAARPWRPTSFTESVQFVETERYALLAGRVWPCGCQREGVAADASPTPRNAAPPRPAPVCSTGGDAHFTALSLSRGIANAAGRSGRTTAVPALCPPRPAQS